MTFNDFQGQISLIKFNQVCFDVLSFILRAWYFGRQYEPGLNFPCQGSKVKFTKATVSGCNDNMIPQGTHKIFLEENLNPKYEVKWFASNTAITCLRQCISCIVISDIGIDLPVSQGYISRYLLCTRKQCSALQFTLYICRYLVAITKWNLDLVRGKFEP